MSDHEHLSAPRLDAGERLRAALRARRGVIVAGPNPNDLLWSDDGPLYLRELIALAQSRDGRLAVVCSRQGVIQDPAPGQPMLPLRLPDAGTLPGQALAELRAQLPALRSSVVVVVDSADLVLPSAGEHSQSTPDQQLLLEVLAEFPRDPALGLHRIVVIARAGGLDPRLARMPGWEVLSIDLPDLHDRTAMARRLGGRSADAPERFAGLEPGLTPEEFGRSSGGLTLDDILRGSLEAAEAGEVLTRRWIHATKVMRIRQRGIDGLEVHPPGNGLRDIVGLPQVRLLIEERRGTDAWPRAIVLAGPPGVGKTVCVRGIADELGWPAVTMGDLRSPWVGESERNLSAFLAAVTAMAPVVVHLDEVDQALGQRESGPSGDSGTSARMLARLWTYLGDSIVDTPVVFVFTTNRPDLLDGATRSRADVIPILHPTPSEQVGMLVLACRRPGKTLEPDVAARAQGRVCLGVVSGRMLVRIAQTATLLGGSAASVTERDLDVATDELLERTDPVDDERTALKALRMTSRASYLPWIAAERRGEPVEILPYVAPLLDERRRLRLDLLDARIAELDTMAARRQAGRHA